jgi:hypothetical protein
MTQELIVVTEKELMAGLSENGRVMPTVVKQELVTLESRREKICHALYDAMPVERVIAEAEALDLDRWSRIVERLDKRQAVKMDVNISAMGILAMFPVAIEQ